MSISEADDCSHDEAAKLILENSNNNESTKRKKTKERKSVRISDDEITFYPCDDSGYTTCRGESVHLLEDWSEDQWKNSYTLEEWTEEVFANDSILMDIKPPSHDTILKNKSENKVTFCDIPKATEHSVEQTITYSEIIVLDSPPSGHKPIHRSVSLESRDNPFIPGGSLDQEAADILKRATIIRDQFILSDDEEENSAVDIKENNSDENNTCQDSKADITEENILPQSVNSTQALPETKQNGKLEEKTISNDSQPVDNNQKDGTLDASLKDKKKQKKCCSLM